MVKVGSKHPFTMDFFEEKYVGYALSDRGWNGWACPGFTLDVVLKMCENPMLGISYDPKRDVVLADYNHEMEKDEYKPETYETEDGKQKLYPVGAWGWCWDHAD